MPASAGVAGCVYALGVLGDIERILIDRQRIAARIREMGQTLRHDYEHLLHERGGELAIVPVLTGSIIFVADLMRELPHKVRIHVIGASSYPGTSTVSAGSVTLSGLSGGVVGGAGGLPDDLSDRHVLIVDDILDSGRTIRRIREEITRRNPRSVRACVLLRKIVASAMNTPCEYVGFDIPDEFVVGYGLDYDNFYRNLPDVATLKTDVVRRK